MADLFEAAAVARQRVAFDGDQQFAVLQRGLVGPDDEIDKRHGPPPARGGQLDLGVMRDQAGRDVGRRRSVDDIAADGGLGADLVVGEPDRAARHGRERARQRRIVEETLDRRRGAEPHALVVDRPFAQLRDFRDVDQRGDIDIARPALARPRQRVGGARDDAIAAAMLASIAAKASASDCGVMYSSQMSIRAPLAPLLGVDGTVRLRASAS